MIHLLAASNAPTAVILEPLLLIFGVATALVALLHLRGIPSILGFLLTGVLLGPAGIGLVEDADTITILAEIGVVMLMFTIGLEVSLKDLARMAKLVLGGGTFQIVVTAAAFTGLAMLVGLPLLSAVAVGLIVSASSTALVLRILGDGGELGTPYGRLSLSILLAQDFAVVALMLVFPMLAAGDVSVGTLALGFGETVAITVGVYLGARFIFPWVLTKLVQLRSREVFLLSTMAVLFGTAMVADALGLSLALGAFVAGLVVSESEYSHQMFAEVLPFRDVFNGLFFASMGLLIDPTAVVENAALLAAFIVACIVLKIVIIWVTAKLMRLDAISSVVAAVALAQNGEFGLVLAQQGAALELITPEHYSLIIAAAVVTMGLTPIVFPWFRDRMRRRGLAADEMPEVSEELRDHVIVVGYGVNGKNVARALLKLNVPLIVVELNQTTVVDTTEDGLEIVYGDATVPALLHHLHIERARAIVSAIADAAATREIVDNARHANPDIQIVARTRYIHEIEPLRKLGANSVVPEEFETSIELVGRVLSCYGASEEAIMREKALLRAERYKHLIEDDDFVSPDVGELLETIHVSQIHVDPSCPLTGVSLKEFDFRAKTGATVVAIIRGDETISPPDVDDPLQNGDTLVVVGDAECLTAVRSIAGLSAA